MRYVTLAALAAGALLATSGSQAANPTTTTPLPTKAKTIHVTDKMWSCKSPQNGTVVYSHIEHANVDAVHLDKGCTGRLTLHIWTNARDAVKLHDGAHDLVVTGDVFCAGKIGIVHQDGVQAMGGTKVTFEGWKENCPSGNNGGFFFNTGTGGQGLPTDVVCDHCSIYYGNASWHISHSLRSGATNSIAYRGPGGAAPKTCWRIEKWAQSPVNSNNHCLPKPPASWVK